MKPKLALVYDAVYPFIKGGGEKRFYEIGLRLSKKYDVHFYGMKLWEGDNVKKIDGMTYHGISKAIPLYDNEKRTIKQAIQFGLNCRKLKNEDFDIIDCCGFPYFSLFPAKRASKKKNKPLISTWHEVWGKDYWKKYLGWKGIFGYWIEKRASKIPDKIIAVSVDTKNKLITMLNVPKEKIIVIPNGIDIKEIDKVKPSKEISDIIFAGRLLSHKNVDVLIKAMKQLSPRHKLVIIGDGPEMSNLKKLVKELKLSAQVSFKGFVKENKEVIALIKSSKIFVLPSEREGFGISVIEANACGIPVVTVDEKDNASKDLIVEGKNGFVCRLDKDDLAKTIQKSLKKKDWKTKQYIQKYNWDNIIKMFEGVYRG
jgi:glycosyltransferase involved in cell wall biosynthesis